MKPSLTVICPVYNEEPLLEDFYTQLSSVLASLNQRYQTRILFVADRGTDGTFDVLRKIAKADPNVQVLLLSARFGHQMSLLAGIDTCESDVAIMMDSDLEHPPTLIPQMLAKYEAGFDVVYTQRDSTAGVSWLRRMGSRLFYLLMARVSDVRIHPESADFRLISKRVLTIFKTQIRERNQFLRGLCSWVGFSSVGLHFDSDKRRAGKSKFNFRTLVNFSVNGLVSFSRRPLRAAWGVGLVLVLMAILGGLWALTAWAAFKMSLPGSLGLGLLMVFFSGFQLIFIGIIGEYLWVALDEARGRPHYIIEEKLNMGAQDLLEVRGKKASR